MLFFRFVVVGVVVLIFLLAQSFADPVKYGPELIFNGSFEYDVFGRDVPDGWRWNVQKVSASAKLRYLKSRSLDGQRSVSIKFDSMDNAVQARLIQSIKVAPKAVYELSYWYRTAADSRIHADVMAYRMSHRIHDTFVPPASTVWTKIVRYIPALKVKDEPVSILLQNRSNIEIWYDKVSMRQTDIEIADAMQERVVLLQPYTSDDQIISSFRQNNKCKYMATINVPQFLKDKDLYLTVSLTHRNMLKTVARIPIKEKKFFFDVKLKDIPNGESLLRGFITSQDGRTIYVLPKDGTASMPLTRLSTKQLEQFRGIDIEQTPLMTFKGEKFFPIGIYGFRPVRNKETDRLEFTRAQKEYLRKYSCFNTVHDYSLKVMYDDNGHPMYASKKADGNLTQTIEYFRSYLDLCEQNNLAVVTELPRTIVENGKGELLTELIEGIKNHNAILCYYSDETYRIRRCPMRYIKMTSGIIRKCDPQRGWMPFDEISERFSKYVDGSIFGYGSDVFTAKRYRRILGRKPLTAVLMVIQLSKVPDHDEMRHYMFNPVIRGARGLMLFVWRGIRFNKTQGFEFSAYGDAVAKPLMELSQITPAILSEQKLPSWYPDIEYDPSKVVVLRCVKDDTAWLLACPAIAGSNGKIAVTLKADTVAQRMFDGKEETLSPCKTQEIIVGTNRVVVLKISVCKIHE